MKIFCLSKKDNSQWGKIRSSIKELWCKYGIFVVAIILLTSIKQISVRSMKLGTDYMNSEVDDWFMQRVSFFLSSSKWRSTYYLGPYTYYILSKGIRISIIVFNSYEI